MKAPLTVDDNWDGLVDSEVIFPRLLPRRIILRKPTRTCSVEGGIAFVRGKRALTVTASGNSLKFLNSLSTTQSTLLPEVSEDLAVILETLLYEGILGDGDFTAWDRGVSGFAMLGELADFIDSVVSKKPDILKLHSLLGTGTAPREVACGWLLEIFIYTFSGPLQLESVLPTITDPCQQTFWKDFIQDESEHWRVYLKIFNELNWDYKRALDLKPLPATSAFLESVKIMAAKGPAFMGAALTFLERPPAVSSMDDYPLYASLYQHYGFKRQSAMPLWAHVVHNATASHDRVGVRVLGNISLLRPAEKNAILAANQQLIESIGNLNKNIIEFYSSKEEASKRFSCITR